MHLELLYCPFDMKDEAPNPFSQQFSMTSLERTLTSMENGSGGSSFDRLSSRKKREIIIRGVLSVTVISGEDLPAMDMNGKSDLVFLFVCLYIKGYATGSEANCTSGLCCRENNPTSPTPGQISFPAPRFGAYLW